MPGTVAGPCALNQRGDSLFELESDHLSTAISAGHGLETALHGFDVTIDVTSIATTGAKKSVNFFGASTTNLLRAGETAGVGHHIALSIVGADRVDSGYYCGKLHQEQLIRSGNLPWTILRAKQFHEFADQILARVPGPIALVPRMRTQPIAVQEVADHLRQIAAGPALKIAPELAGPKEESLLDMARRVVRTRGKHRLVVPLQLPGLKAMRTGALLPDGPRPRGQQTFGQCLAELD